MTQPTSTAAVSATEMTVDGRTIPYRPGQTIMQACDAVGLYIPRLCDHEGLEPAGSCRVCSVQVGGRTVPACCTPAQPGLVVENDTKAVQRYRQDLVEMLFHEGNHLCPICEASGRCELQATAYRLSLSQAAPYPWLQPVRALDASHPDIALDTNRCIFCARCIRASRDLDGKQVFGYVGRGINKRLGVNGDTLAATNATLDDAAIQPGLCPVGCILRKHRGFDEPIGERRFDHHPIGESPNADPEGNA